jgi:hypothetical protein
MAGIDEADDIVITVIAILLQDAPVAAKVADRVFPRMLPDATEFPAVVVTKIYGSGEYTNDGDAGIEDSRVQVDCYSDRGAADCYALKKAVRKLLSGYKGGALSGSPCAIDACFVINDLDMSETGTERAGPRLKRRMLEFRVWNREV